MDHGAYRMSGGSNWDGVWDHTDAAALLDYTEAKERWDAHQAADLERAVAAYHETARRKDEEFALLAKPLGGVRLALRRLFG